VSLKYYFDEDSADSALIDALRSRGFYVLAPDDVGLLGASDLAQLEWCAQHGFVLVTHNIGDFCRLHRQFLEEGKSHSGMVLVRQQTLRVGEKLRRLMRIADGLSADDMRDRLEFLSAWG